MSVVKVLATSLAIMLDNDLTETDSALTIAQEIIIINSEKCYAVQPKPV